MNKLGKIVAIVAGIVVVLVLTLIILAKVVITPERVKQTVLPIAEEAMQRKIELGEINVSIFSGIELQDLKVYEADGKDLFVSTDLVRLKYQLLPLLAMKVVVDEVTVVKPHIQVMRLQDGSFSFDDIAGGGKDKGSDAAKSESDGSTPISLLVSTVSISDGALVFIDHMVSPGKAFRTDISDLQVAAKGISLTGVLPVTVSGKINAAKMTADGNINLDGPAVDLKVKLDDFDVVTFLPYFKEALPGKLESLKLALDTTVSGGAEKISAAGVLRGSGLNMVLAAMPDAPLKNASIVIDYDLGLDMKAGALDLRSSRLDFNGLTAEAKGTVSRLFATPQLSITLNVPGIDLQQALQSVPASLVEGVKDLNPTGRVTANAQLSGPVDAEPANLLKGATVSFDNVQASTGGQRPALFGKLNLTNQRLVSEGLEMRLGENRARIDLNAGNLFGKVITVKADVTSDQFQLDPLLGAGGGAGAAAGGGTPASKADELGPFDIPVQASGTINIGKTLYKGLSIDNFIARYKLQDNILTISQLDGNIAGGSFANKATVNLGVKGLAYNADIGVKTIQADPLLTAFIPKAAGALLGAMNLDMSVKGRGTEWETLSKQLSGQGGMLVADGRVISPGLVKGFASFLQLSNVDEIRFKNFQGDIQIVDGKLKINSSILSDEIKLFPTGTVGLDGTMNISMDTRLSPQVAARLDTKGKVTQYLTDDEGWSQIPLLISGNYASPRFGLDPKGIQKQATKAIGKELGRQLDKLLGVPKTEPGAQGGEQPQQEQPAEDPATKLLKEGLKGLFGN